MPVATWKDDEGWRDWYGIPDTIESPRVCKRTVGMEFDKPVDPSSWVYEVNSFPPETLYFINILLICLINVLQFINKQNPKGAVSQTLRVMALLYLVWLF